MKSKLYNLKNKYAYYCVPVIIFMVAMLPFTFCTTIWGDEGFTILTLNESIWKIMQITAADVHPPLYYCIAKIAVSIFGNTIMVLKWVSIVPVLLLLIKVLVFYKQKYEKLSVRIGVVIAVTLLCIPNVIDIATELRMYSWAMFFVTSTGIAGIYIYKNGFAAKYICQIILYALGAAYTHYFALISVAIIIMILCIDTVIRRKDAVKYCVYIIGSCSIGYLPWLFILINQLKEVSGNYWIAPIGIKRVVDYMQYPFDTMSRNFYLILFGIILFFNMIFIFQKSGEEKKEAIASMGLVSIFFLTVASGIVLSILIRPIFVIRYATPCLVLLWVGIFVGIRNITKDKILLGLFVGVVLLDGVFLYNTEFAVTRNQGFHDLQEYAMEHIEGDDFIYTNSAHFEWTILPYYFGRDDITYSSSSNEIFDWNDSEQSTIYYVEVGDLMEFETEMFSNMNGSYQKVFETTVPTYGNVNVWKLQE